MSNRKNWIHTGWQTRLTKEKRHEFNSHSEQTLYSYSNFIFVQCSHFISAIAFVNCHICFKRNLAQVINHVSSGMIDTYSIHHWRTFRSSYRKLAWMGFEPTTTEFRSDALTDSAIRPWVQLAVRANTLQLLQFLNVVTTILCWSCHIVFIVLVLPTFFYFISQQIISMSPDLFQHQKIWSTGFLQFNHNLLQCVQFSIAKAIPSQFRHL